MTCSLVVLELTQHIVKRRQCYDKVTSSSDIVSKRIQELLRAYFMYFEIENVVFNGEQEK